MTSASDKSFNIRTEGAHLESILFPKAYLFLVVKALIVIFQRGDALLLAGLTLGRVHNIASQNLLPEGVAAAGT